MEGYKKHVFICQHERGPEAVKRSCGMTGTEYKNKLKKEITTRGLNKEIRINASGCLGKCKFGPTMVIYPEGTWYGGVQPEDLDEILNESILDNKVIERLRIKQEKNEEAATS